MKTAGDDGKFILDLGVQVEEERHGAGLEKLDACSVPEAQKLQAQDEVMLLERRRGCTRGYSHPEEIALQATSGRQLATCGEGLIPALKEHFFLHRCACLRSLDGKLPFRCWTTSGTPARMVATSA